MDNYSLADIAAATGKGNGFGFNDDWIGLAIFAMIFGGNGFGWGNGRVGGVMDQYTLNSDFATLQRQIDSGVNSLERKGDTINAGLCDGFYAMNTGMLNGFATVNANIAECCCTTQRNIDALRYDNAQNTNQIMNAMHVEAETTRALIRDTETQRLRDELGQARAALSNQAQSNYILGQLGKFYTNPPCENTLCARVA